MFSIVKRDTSSKARAGILKTNHGPVATPVFLPIATKGAIRGVRADEVKEMGASMLLANTYHLWQQPGDELIKKAGGLHKFMSWGGPIFTDSGGYQLFSLGEKTTTPTFQSGPRPGGVRDDQPKVIKITESGVTFRSGIDGTLHELTPEKSIQIQNNLGSDVMVVLDEFTGELDNYDKVKATVERTTRWANRAKVEHIKLGSKNLLLGIVQGALFEDLRKKSAQAIRELGFDGYCIGGVAVGGESSEKQYLAVEQSVPYLEDDKYRHLLRVGTPEQIVQNVARGIDSFDCVIPTREARHGKIYASAVSADELSYTTFDISNSKFKFDKSPLDLTCDCFACKNHSRQYLHHLYKSKELLGIRLLTDHNLTFYLSLMNRIRSSISDGSFGRMISKYKKV